MEALTSVGNFLKGNWQKVIPGALAGGGFLSNWLNARKQNSRQQFIENLIKDPKKFNAYVQSFEKPLNAGLVQGTNNQVQAFLGERGLSQSPSIASEIDAQALGPLIQQNQQNAVNEAEGNLGILGGLQTPGQTDISSALQLLFNKPAASTGGVPAAPSTVGLTSGIYGGPSGNAPPWDESSGVFPPQNDTSATSGAFDINNLLNLFGSSGAPA